MNKRQHRWKPTPEGRRCVFCHSVCPWGGLEEFRRWKNERCPGSPDKKSGFKNTEFKGLLGSFLLDVEFNTDGVSGCGEEWTLHFSDGREINIYVHPDTGLVVEMD